MLAQEHAWGGTTSEWVVGLFGFLGGVYLILQIFSKVFPTKKGGEVFVTKAELIEEIVDLKTAIARIEARLEAFAPRTESDKEMSRLEARLDKHESYMHTRMHDMSTAMQLLLTNQAKVDIKLDIIAKHLKENGTSK